MLLLIFLSVSFFNKDSLIKIGLNYGYNLDFKKAESCFYSLTKNYPDLPEGYFFQSLLLQFIMLDNFSDLYKRKYYELIKKTINLAKKNNSFFYLGSAYLYWALFEGWRKNYWQTFILSQELPKYFQKALATEENLPDCYLGLGLYEYFKTKANKYLLGLKIFGDKEKALNFLYKATQEAKLLRITSQYAYAWVLVEEKRFKEAESILKNLINLYPSNKVFLRLLRDLYFKKGDYRTCLEIAEKLKDLEERKILENELIMGKAYFYLKDFKKAKEHFDYIIRNKEIFKKLVRFKDHYQEALKYYQKLKWY
uniref:Tetratricopeptide repeat protein n=1 Tax=candidate division WOR-3 bacterium TaxID=2052148 RepID=A0A7V3ZUD2_UNCW3